VALSLFSNAGGKETKDDITGGKGVEMSFRSLDRRSPPINLPVFGKKSPEGNRELGHPLALQGRSGEGIYISGDRGGEHGGMSAGEHNPKVQKRKRTQGGCEARSIALKKKKNSGGRLIPGGGAPSECTPARGENKKKSFGLTKSKRSPRTTGHPTKF